MLEAQNGSSIDAIAGFRAVHRALYQACVQQFLQVLGDRALCQWQHLHDFAADAGVAFGYFLEYRQSCRMRECFGELGKARSVSVELFCFGRCHSSFLNNENPFIVKIRFTYRKITIKVSFLQKIFFWGWGKMRVKISTALV